MTNDPIRDCVKLLILGFSLLAGCREPEPEEPKTVEVSGIVTLDGEPLEGVAVHFTHGLSHCGTGVTDADGRYRLAMGAEPGVNSVHFTPIHGLNETREGDLPEPGGDDLEPIGNISRMIPEKYTDAVNPPFTFLVSRKGTAEANFALTWD